MPHVTADGVLETSTFTGTGPIALAGAVQGFRRFNAIPGIVLNDTVTVTVEGVDANGVRTGQWETFLGTYSSADTLTRTLSLEGSEALPVAFTAGTKYVYLSFPARRSVFLDDLLATRLPISAPPTAEPAGTAGMLRLWAREIAAGFVIPKVVGPNGMDWPLAKDRSFNFVADWSTSAATIVSAGASAPTTTGTLTAGVVGTGSAKLNAPRTNFPTTTTAGTLSTWSHAANTVPVWRGAAAGEGGFAFVLRFGLEGTLQAGQRGFWGLANQVAAGTNVDPATSTASQRIGVGFNLNTGNWFLNVCNGSAITWTDLGANFPLNNADLLELVLFNRPFLGTVGDVSFRLRRYTTSSAVHAFETPVTTITANLPPAASLLYPWHWITNNATAAVSAWFFNRAGLVKDW